MQGTNNAAMLQAHPDHPMELSEAAVEAVVREVTAEEVAHYHEFGWAMPGLGRFVASHHRSSNSSHHIHEHIRCLCL
jgi:hypothetical protein